MKKLLLILAILPGLAFGAARTWSSSGSTDANDGANYSGSGAILATDSLIFDATSVVNATQTAALKIGAIVIAAGYTGTYNDGGYIDTIGGTVSITPGGTFTASAIWAQTADANWTYGNSGTYSIANQKIELYGTGTVAFNKAGLTIKRFYCSATGKTTTINGAQTMSVSDTIIGGSGNLVLTTGLTGRSTAALYCINLASTSISGTSTLSNTYNGLTPYTMNISGLSMTGSVTVAFTKTGSATTGLMSINGNIAIPAAMNISNAYGGTKYTTNTNGNTITVSGALQMGTNGVGAVTCTLNCDGATINSGSFNSGGLTSGVGTVLNIEAGTWNNAGAWTFNSATVVNPGTSVVTLDGSGAQTVTSAGKLFYDLIVNNTGTAFVALADSLTCNDITLTDGPFNSASYGISAVDMIYTSQDSSRFQNLWLTGDFTRGALADKCDTAGQHIRFSAGVSHTMAAAGKTYARVTTSGPLTITGGATIATLSYGIDGIPVTIATGTTLTAGTVSIGGTTEAPDTIQGAGAGATLTAPQDTVYNLFRRNMTFTNPSYLGNIIGGGNNTNEKYMPSYDSVVIRNWFRQSARITCNWLHVRATDSSYFNDTIIVRDSIVYAPGAKPRALAGSRVQSTPGFTLTVKLNGHTNTPTVYNRSRILWR